MRGRIDPPVADVLPPVRPAVGIQFVLVRRTVPARIDPIRIERHLVIDAVLQDVGHHLRRLVPAARRNRQNRRDDFALGIARNLVVEHKPMDERLEFPPRLVRADENGNRRLADRFSGHEPEVGSLHADFDVNRLARIRKPRLPRPRPADCEQIAVLVVETQFEKRNIIIRRPPTGCRQDLLFSGCDMERFRNKVRCRAGRSAQDIQRDRLCRFRIVDRKVQRPEIVDDSRRFCFGQIRQLDGVFFRREILVDLAIQSDLQISVRSGQRFRPGAILRRFELRAGRSRF